MDLLNSTRTPTSVDYKIEDAFATNEITIDGVEIPVSPSTWCAASFYWWARAMKAQRVAEIGVRGANNDGGASTLALLAAMRHTGGLLYSMDVQDCFSVEKAVNYANLAPWWRFQKADSHVTPLPVDDIDLLFIDGDHTYEGVKADYELHTPNVKEGGVIALHDPKACPGVARFVEELSSTHTVTNLPIGYSGLALEVKQWRQ